MRSLAVVLLLAASTAAAAPLDGAEQLVVVRARSWDARSGTLRRYTRVEGRWKAEGKPAAVALGGKGLAWGRGVAPSTPEEAPAAGPHKREGDARTPAGVFRLSAATGAATEPPPGVRVPYRQADDKLRCVDDGASAHYNTVTAATGKDDWTSSEAMLNPPVYDWTIFVEHNPLRTPGGGSCIFVHVGRSAGSPTLGCTAMPRAEIETLLVWLDPARQPLFVVLPDRTYASLRKSWDLP